MIEVYQHGYIYMTFALQVEECTGKYNRRTGGVTEEQVV